MVVIYLFAGMGSQMFQYALYKSLKAKGRKVYIYDATESGSWKLRKPIQKYLMLNLMNINRL